MGGVGGGGDVAGDTGLVEPDDVSTGFDGQVGGNKSGRGEKDGDFLAFFLFFDSCGVECGLYFALTDCSGGGRVSAFFGQEEIVDGAVDNNSDDRVNGNPLPKRPLGVVDDLILVFHVWY